MSCAVNAIRFSEGERPAWSKRRELNTSSLIKIMGSNFETSFRQRFFRDMHDTHRLTALPRQ
eukprot:4429676-Pyramimonas_sp.AAC.1